MTWDSSIGEKIRRLRQALGETQASFAFRLGVEQPTVSRWEKGGVVDMKHQAQIAKLAGMSTAEFFQTKSEPRLVPIVGYVSGGESFVPSGDIEQAAEIEHVMLAIPAEDQIAVRVRGDSMRPVYRNGDVIIGSRRNRRNLAVIVGKDCIVKTADGEGYVKVVHRGTMPGRFTLRSYNPAYTDIENVELEWAAPITHIVRAG